MTAEIAILNKHAVALAADSAVTITSARPKIFASADKIFTLSKYHPVGAMIYGSASFMGVPWETIIKTFRRRLGDRSHPTVAGYADEFLDFLRTSSIVESPEAEGDYLNTHAAGRTLQIVQEILNESRAFVARSGGITRSQSMRIGREVIRRIHTEDCEPPADTETSEYLGYIEAHFATKLSDWIREVIEELPISNATFGLLKECVLRHLARNPPHDMGLSGVVIAGYGDDDIYPAVVALAVDVRLGPYLRIAQRDDNAVTYSNSAIIQAFAQGEVVHAFMEGVDPDYQRAIENDMLTLVQDLPAAVIESVSELTDAQKQAYTIRLAGHSQDLHDQVCENLRQFRREYFSSPVVSVVNFLPKDELGMMAESLVGLTSFKRRVSFDAETVGGPVDVALISKGDGFVWVKRKHYFPIELNPHFKTNYFR